MASHLDDAQQEAKLDLTPMIDCVFLLIIFFLCIEFKSLESKLQAFLPKDKGSQNFKVEPQEQLSLRIELVEMGQKTPRRQNQKEFDEKGNPTAWAYIGHRVKYAINATPFDQLDKFEKALEKIKADPASSMVPDAMNPGKRKLIPVVIEPQPGTTYGDVAQVVDRVKAIGFEELNFGGGRGPAPAKR
ncbi:MAG: ExbD/TolR family protein [Planctomycetota bacterium]